MLSTVSSKVVLLFIRTTTILFLSANCNILIFSYSVTFHFILPTMLLLLLVRISIILSSCLSILLKLVNIFSIRLFSKSILLATVKLFASPVETIVKTANMQICHPQSLLMFNFVITWIILHLNICNYIIYNI